MKVIITAILFLLLINTNIFAQTDTTKSPLMRIILSDGTEYWGRIVLNQKEHLSFITKNMQSIKIPKATIKDIIRAEDLPFAQRTDLPKPAAAVKPEEPDYIDKNKHRMFLFPTARSMKTGEGYFSLNEVFFHMQLLELKRY